MIDEGHLPRKALEPLDSPVAGIFQLEQSSGLEEIRRIIDTLIEVLDDPELRELRQDMATWIRRSILQKRLPGIKIPELQDLQEAKTMLAEHAPNWPQQWMAEGYQKGRTSGRLEGQRVALSQLLEEKFGVLEPCHADLIAEASEDQLRSWLKKILTATTLDDLFRP